jgi:imidazolonepropionase-like amidohydrolase
VLLRNARVITMRGDEVLDSADVLVSGNRIESVGQPGSLRVAPGTASFDLAGKTIIPGLVDVHAHPHYSGFEIFPERKWEYVVNLAYGVTTMHDPSAHSIDVFAEAEMVEAGEMLGPRIYSSGDVLYGGGQASVYAKVDGPEDALHVVRRMRPTAPIGSRSTSSPAASNESGCSTPPGGRGSAPPWKERESCTPT